MTDPVNHRLKDLGNGLIAEYIAFNTEMLYNPTTEQASVVYNSRLYLPVNGAYIELGKNVERFHKQLDAQMTRTYEAGIDPVTGTDLSTVSVAGLMMIIKKDHEETVNEEFQRRIDENDNPDTPWQGEVVVMPEGEP